MKELSRTVGICGAPFDRTENEMETLVFVLVRMDGRIEGISKARVETDGTDSTEAIIGEIQKKYSERCNYIMMPGITFAGLNICNISEVYSATVIPVLSIVKHSPDTASIKRAIIRHTYDPEKRISILEQASPVLLSLRENFSVYANLAGIHKKEAELLLRKSIIFGKVPEPLRLARMISGIL